MCACVYVLCVFVRACERACAFVGVRVCCVRFFVCAFVYVRVTCDCVCLCVFAGLLAFVCVCCVRLCVSAFVRMLVHV